MQNSQKIYTISLKNRCIQEKIVKEMQKFVKESDKQESSSKKPLYTKLDLQKVYGKRQNTRNTKPDMQKKAMSSFIKEKDHQQRFIQYIEDQCANRKIRITGIEVGINFVNCLVGMIE